MNETLIKKAQQLYQQGKRQEALDIYLKLLDENPEQADILHTIGFIYAQMGKNKKALEYIEKAITIQPDVATYHNSKGNVLMRLDKLKEAIKAYQRAINFDPKYAPAQNNLGNCFYHRGKLNEAKKAYETAIALQPNYVDAHYNYGILLAKLGKNNEAIKKLKTAVQLMPNYARAYGQLGEIYLQQGNHHDAMENFKKRLKLQPNHAETWHSLGQAFQHNNQIDEAIKAYQQALIHEPFHPECNHNLATAYLKSGDQGKALNYYMRQLEVSPMLETYYNIGVLLMYQERNKDALQYLEHAAQLDPEYFPTYLNMGSIYLKLNQVQNAIKSYQTAAKIKPNDAEIQHILAALTQEQTPEAAPAEYLQHLFDQYATYYDQHLVKYLHYDVPEKIFQAVVTETGIDSQKWKILDLGCGTGLCGEKFKKVAHQLIGIDISENMIQMAREKKIYDELRVADVQVAIDHYKKIDLIIAADVFIYIGDLVDLFTKAFYTLKPGGLFVFSLEKTNIEPYILQKNIRYAHSRNYIESLIKENKFETIRFDNIVLRMQRNKPVEGFLVVLKRASTS